MSVLIAVQVLAVLSTGLKAGALFGDQMGARFARPGLSPSSFVKFQQVQLVRWERFMPALSATSIVSGIAWLGLIWARIGSVSFVLVTLATGAAIFSMVLAVKGCLPVVRQLMTWSIDSPPTDLMETWARWEHVNAIRTSLAVIGFVCVALAVASSPNER